MTTRPIEKTWLKTRPLRVKLAFRSSIGLAIGLSGCASMVESSTSQALIVERLFENAKKPVLPARSADKRETLVNAYLRPGELRTAPGQDREGPGDIQRVAADAADNPPAVALTRSIPPTTQEYPVDLTTALRLAESENPLIAEARQRIGEAVAVRQGARALLLPTLNIGTDYHAHSGNLQRSSGRILNLNEASLYTGGGTDVAAAGTVETPAIGITSQLTDAIFAPLAANQRVQGARFLANATANQILLEVTQFHFDLLAAEAILNARLEAVNQANLVATLTKSYADAQQGRRADAERAATVLSLFENEVRLAEEDVAVSAARLARRLHLDQSVRLRPIAPGVESIQLVDPGIPLETLIATSIRNRPEINASSTEIIAKEVQYRQEIYRPLLPTIAIGMSGGGFGGGSNLTPPLLSHFAGRTDFDAQIFWTVRNLGFGNHSLQKRRWAEVGQAVSERSRRIAEARSEVGAAYGQVAATRRQVGITTRQQQSAESGFAEDVTRIRNTVGRPIEVINSLELLNTARVDRIRAIAENNKAEFRLFVALGTPPPLGDSANAPIPPAPIATPPIGPPPPF